VSTDLGAEAALLEIEGLIQVAIDASAAFGSGQKRVEIQNEFVSKLMDSLTTGIGGLIDADMESASARLQALQVQQQLGLQALSIANQSPQNILALFN
jgi:flagellin